MLDFYGTPVYRTTLTFDGFDHDIVINGCLLPHGFNRHIPAPENDNDETNLKDGKYGWSVDVKAFHVVELMADTEEEARVKADAYVESIGGSVDGTSEVEPVIC